VKSLLNSDLRNGMENSNIIELMDNDIIMDSYIMASDLILMIVILINNDWLLTTIINGQRSVECLFIINR